MKKTHLLQLWTAACVATLVIASCDSQLNIAPVNTVDSRAATETAQGLQATLTGAYDRLGLGSLLGGQIQLYADIYGDDEELSFEGTFGFLNQIWIKTLPTTNLGGEQTWRDAYRTINLANVVLQPASLQKFDSVSRRIAEGEALFIRGTLYFELARIYGKTWGDGNNATNLAVPIVLTPTIVETSSTDLRTRNTVAEVYTQAIADLTRAESLLPSSTDGTRAKKSAAAAILARVYLQQQRYTEARDAANRAITANQNSFVENFASAFSEKSGGLAQECIFRIAVDAQDGNSINDLNTYYAASEYGGRGGDFAVQDKHLALYDPKDIRGQFFEDVGLIVTSKFNDQFGDVPVVRITEMYLVRAECNARLGSSTGATPANDLNRIRTRAGVSSIASPTVDDILKERRLELAFEGVRLHDQKRTRASVRYINQTILATSDRLVFPIPQREIDVNNKLVQNAGY
jgi:starch-binding outer membrane protein, SusD/RagB family